MAVIGAAGDRTGRGGTGWDGTGWSGMRTCDARDGHDGAGWDGMGTGHSRVGAGWLICLEDSSSPT